MRRRIGVGFGSIDALTGTATNPAILVCLEVHDGRLCLCHLYDSFSLRCSFSKCRIGALVRILPVNLYVYASAKSGRVFGTGLRPDSGRIALCDSAPADPLLGRLVCAAPAFDTKDDGKRLGGLGIKLLAPTELGCAMSPRLSGTGWILNVMKEGFRAASFDELDELVWT